MRPSADSGVTSPAVRRLIVSDAVSATGQGLVLPLVLIYLHQVRGIPLGTTGLLLAIPGVIGIIAVPVSGAMMDRLGPRRVLAGVLILLALSETALAFVRTATWAAPVLLLQGAASGPVFAGYTTLLASLTTGATQQRAFAMNFTVLNVGFGLGSLISGLVVDAHHPATFQAMFLGNALAALVAAGLLFLVPAPRTGGQVPETGARTGYRLVLADRMLRRIVLIALLLALTGYAALDSGMPAYANVVADVPARIVALSLSINTLLIVVVQMPILRLIRGRRRSGAIAGVGLVWGVAWLLLGAAALPGSHGTRAGMVIAFNMLFGLGETLMAPSIGPLVNTLAPDRVRGRANALTSGMNSAATVVSPAISAGFIAAGLGGLWIALLAAGCLAVTASALRLRRTLAPERDIAQPAVVPASAARLPDAATLNGEANCVRNDC